MKNPEVLYKEIKDWADQSFGADRKVSMILEHLHEELQELSIAVDNKDKGFGQMDEVLMEMADMQILLFNLMQRMGVCYENYFDWVNVKHSVNLTRQWEVRDGKMKHKIFYCAFCKKNQVDAQNGFDTCTECMAKI